MFGLVTAEKWNSGPQNIFHIDYTAVLKDLIKLF